MITSHCGDTSRSRSIVPPGPLPVQYPISLCPFLVPVDGAAATADGGAGCGTSPGAGGWDAGHGVAAARKSDASGKLYGPSMPVYHRRTATLATCHAKPRACTTDAGPVGRSLRIFVLNGSANVYRVAGLSPPHR